MEPKRRSHHDLPSVRERQSSGVDFSPEEEPTRPSGMQRAALPPLVKEVDARRGRKVDPREE